MARSLLFLFPFVARAASEEVAVTYSELELGELFRNWMDEFEKGYITHNQMSAKRQVWIQNHQLIEAHNHQQDPIPSYFLGHNQFSDMTLEEFHTFHGLGDFSNGGKGHPPLAESKVGVTVDAADAAITPQMTVAAAAAVGRRLDAVPDSVNWVDKGAVSPVKNQWFCGSCWAFSAVGAIEGARFIDTGNIDSLSVQQFIDCDRLDRGCYGGLMDNAFAFDENSTTGICSDASYPYAGYRHYFTGCAEQKDECDDMPHTKVSSFIDVNQTNLDLMEAIAIQPVSIAIEADKQAFQFYKSGIFDGECGVDPDHGVLAVGYGTEDSFDYWLVKNSWGATWGDAGYIKMARDATNPLGTCGILSFPSRPRLTADDTDAPAASQSEDR